MFVVCYPDLHSDETDDTGIITEGEVTEVTLMAVLNGEKEGIDSSLSLSYSGFNPDLQSTILSLEDPSSTGTSTMLNSHVVPPNTTVCPPNDSNATAACMDSGMCVVSSK